MNRRLASLLVCALFASLLRCAKDPTGFFVTVTIPAGLPTIQYLQVKLLDTAMVTDAMPPRDMPPPWLIDEESMMMPLGAAPHTFVVSRTARHSRITIEVTGSTTRIGAPVLSNPYDRVTVTFEDDALYDVPMTLRMPCAGLMMPCSGTQHCSDSGGCAGNEPRTLTRHRW